MSTGPLAEAPGSLFAALRESIGKAIETRRIVALLVLKLRRADRLKALAGDAESVGALHQVLAAITAVLRPGDRVSPVSHDEIWLVLPNLPHPDLSVVAANRILHVLRPAGTGGTLRIELQPRIGIACAPVHSSDPSQLLEFADLARRAALVSENGYAVFQPIQQSSLPDPQLEAELREAVRLNAIDVHYQPQFDLRVQRSTAAEVLLRWQRTNGTPVGADVAARIAESSDILRPLTLLVVNTALRHGVGFRRAGIPVRLSVNLSPRLVGDDELPELVSELTETWNLTPTDLTLEVTESAVLEDARRTEQMLRQLKRLGIRIALDDFGTGYSSLAHLRRFEFDELKIDKVFIRNLLTSSSDEQIVCAMIDLAHNFGMEVVAEGVEDAATLERLGELGCDLIQGYFIARPMPEAAFRHWWQAQHPVESTG